MSKTKETALPFDEADVLAEKPRKKKKKKKGSGAFGRFIRRFLLLLFTIILLAAGTLVMVMNTVFNGPSEAARNVLTMSLSEASATKWVPGIFLGDEVVEEIRNKSGEALEEEYSDASQVVINKDSALTDSDEWAGFPDGIRIEEYKGETYNAHIMIIRDPAQIYMATSTDGAFNMNTPGTRIHNEIADEGAIAAINAGAFNDDGSANAYVGSIPAGLLMVNGEVKSNQFHDLVPEEGFAGFTNDNILVVAKSMTADKAKELGIRDGCEFGPVLIMNGTVNQEAYNANSGYNPRTAIGQRADGAVIFLCIDGRQASSLGGTYRDVIDIMVEYGAVNACNMDGGSSSVMMYLDSQGRYGEAGEYVMINSYSLLQSEPRRMPNFWMVRPADKED
ncbi:MAG: phosphodiester glycosidase family protein [Oscillospiraceae bacterium]|nr:phosphodiester glycosidase family protein [Oscillospiraceae bacterium]